MWEYIDQEIKKTAESDKNSPNLSCQYKSGPYCPNCEKEILEYNNLLNLVCPACGYERTANFT